MPFGYFQTVGQWFPESDRMLPSPQFRLISAPSFHTMHHTMCAYRIGFNDIVCHKDDYENLIPTHSFLSHGHWTPLPRDLLSAEIVRTTPNKGFYTPFEYSLNWTHNWCKAQHFNISSNKLLTKSNNCWTWDAIAFHLIIMWLEGSFLLLLADVLGNILIPPVFLPINWFNWTNSMSLVSISITDWLKKIRENFQEPIQTGFQSGLKCYTYQNNWYKGKKFRVYWAHIKSQLSIKYIICE